MNDNAGVEKNAKMPEKGRFAYADALMKFDIADRLTLRNVGFGRRELGQRGERGTRAVVGLYPFFSLLKIQPSGTAFAPAKSYTFKQ